MADEVRPGSLAAEMGADLITRPRNDAYTRSTGSLLRALEGLVTSTTAASQEALNISKEIQASQERTAKMFGSVLDRVEVILGITGGKAGSRISVGAGSGGIARTGLGGEATAGGGSGVTPTGIYPGSKGVPEGDVSRRREGGPGLPTSWDDGRDTSLRDLRSSAASRATEAMQDWGTGAKQTWRNEKGQFQSRLVPKGSPTWAADTINAPPGWRATAVSGVKQGVASLGEGASFGQAFGSMGMGAAKVAGIAGMAYTGINWGLNTAETQRAKNAEYQALIGGSNFEQFGERWDEMRFRWSMRGTMSGGDAAAIYKGAAAQYGSDKAARSEYQNAAISMYRRSGLGADESTAILNMAVNSSNDNLSQLADTIGRLGKEAKKAGISAKIARDYFTASFQNLDQVTNGAVQINLAELQTKAKIAMGRQYEDVDTSRQMSELGLMIYGQQNGLSLNQITRAMVYGGSVTDAMGRTLNGTDIGAGIEGSMFDRAAGFADPTGAMRRWIDKEVASRRFDKNPPSEDQMDELTADMMAAFPQMDPRSFQNALQLGGFTDVTMQQAPGWFLNRYARRGAGVQDQLDEQNRLMTAPPKFGVTRQEWDALAANANRKGKWPTLTGEYKDVADYIENSIGINMDEGNYFRMTGREEKQKFDYTANGKEGLQNALARQAVEGRLVNPTMLRLLQSFDQLGDDARLVIQTKDGPKSVELGEAAYLYGDQIRANPDQVMIQGGRSSGQTIEQAFDIQGSGKNAGVDMDEFASYDRTGVGVGVEEGWDKAVGSGTQGKVEIVIRPPYDKYLAVASATGQAIAGGQRPPANSDRSSENLGD